MRVAGAAAAPAVGRYKGRDWPVDKAAGGAGCSGSAGAGLPPPLPPPLLPPQSQLAL
jgi:hypothetical protein